MLEFAKEIELEFSTEPASMVGLPKVQDLLSFVWDQYLDTKAMHRLAFDMGISAEWLEMCEKRNSKAAWAAYRAVAESPLFEFSAARMRKADSDAASLYASDDAPDEDRTIYSNSCARSKRATRRFQRVSAMGGAAMSASMAMLALNETDAIQAALNAVGKAALATS